MKKLLLLSISMMFIFQVSYAQQKKSPRPNDKYINVNAGIGLFPTYLKDAGKSQIFPLSLSADYKLAKNFSIGTFVGYSVTDTDLKTMRDGSISQWRNYYFNTGVRLAAQSRDINGWNIYGGMILGYSHTQVEMLQGELEKAGNDMGIKERSGKMLFTGFMGARYSFSQKMGMFAEIGMGESLIKAGISYRLIR
jgi:hypothetical protein